MEDERRLEDEYGWETVRNLNTKIGIALGYEPEISYQVGTMKDGKPESFTYSPGNFPEWFRTPYSQKVQCGRWIVDHLKRFPHSEEYEVIKVERYPRFHADWNSLIQAVVKCGKPIQLSTDLHDVWKQLVNAV